MLSLQTYSNFQNASREVLKYLHSRLGFDLWMITRTQDENWIVLTAEDHGYSVKSFDVFKWTDSFCSRMVEGLGPSIAPRSIDVPAYLEAPFGQRVQISAYIGVPLNREDGTLFGTLCAIDPEPKNDEIELELPLVQMLARMLATVLESEIKLNEEIRRTERANSEANTDALTGLYNRRGWEQLASAEEARCKRFGHAAGIISIDLDDLKKTNDTAGHNSGDQLLIECSRTLKTSIRESDLAARVGGDEFVVLATETNQAGLDLLQQRIETKLEKAGISASLGRAIRRPSMTIHEAWEIADRAMYVCKRIRKRPSQHDCSSG